MIIPEIKIVLHENNQKWMPTKANKSDAGWDLFIREVAKYKDMKDDGYYTIHPHDRVLIKTGVYLELPEGWEAQIRSRSGLSLNEGLVVLNSPGTIDAGYRDEICVILHNSSQDKICIRRFMKVAQMIFAPVYTVNFDIVSKLSGSDRGINGFGSSGIK